MPIFIFNSQRQFWNDTTREFQDEPHEIRSATEAEMEIRMAGRKDRTSDIIHFEEGSREVALEHIRTIEFSKDRLEILTDMNSCLR